MIILYEKNERDFTSLGLGVLRDALSCGVSEGLNDAYELEMEYPIDGLHFNKITLQRIIFAKPNQYDNPQPFRIYNITKPLNGIITINAEHISYDMSGYTVKPFDAVDLEDTLQKIQNGSILQSPFRFHTDMIVPVSMKTKIPYNMRALLAGDSGSVLDIYNGHYKFDKFDVHLLANRGEDRGVVIRYGKNMTELEQEISSEKIYTGIFPFYSAKNTTTQVVMTRFFKSAYEVPTSRPLSVNWFSWSDGGKPFIPLLEDIPVQNKTPGPNFNLVYCFKKEILQLVYVRSSDNEYSQTWLSDDHDDGVALTPQVKTIYKVVSEGAYQNKNYIWTGTEYELYEGDGFWFIPDPTPEPPEVIPESQTIETEDYIDLSTEEDSGIIYIDEVADPQRILTLDMSSQFGEKPTAEVLRGKALDYLLNNDIQELVNSTTVSFIKLADSPEYKRFADLETVKLGDTVKIIYEKLGVEASLQVIKTVFNVITEKYEEIELGKKAANLADSALTKNDSISSLTNDARYTDQITVKKFIAETITADYIQAKNANLSVAQIEQLETARIRVTGLIEASMVDIDKIVSRLLVADDADIKNVLTAGEIVVKGTIYAEAGEIGGCKIEDGQLQVPTANITDLLNVEGKIDAALIEVEDIQIGTGQVTGLLNVEGKIDAALIEVEDIQIGTGQVTGLLNVEGKIDAALIEVEDILIGTGQVTGLLNVEGKIDAALIEVEDILIGTGQVTGLLNVEGKIDAALIEVEDILIGTGQVTGLLNVEGKIDAALIEVEDILIGTGQVTGLLNVEGKIDAALIEVEDIQIGTGQVTGLLNVEGKIDAALIEVEDILIGTGQVTGLLNVDGKIDAALIEVEDILIGTGQVTGLLNVEGKIDAALIEVDDIVITNSIDINSRFIVDSDGDVTITGGSIDINDGYTYVDSYIRTGATTFSNMWLSSTVGGSALTPEVNKCYWILTEGNYQYKKYKWNGAVYEPYYKRYFIVDTDGNVMIGGSININDKFTVDAEGNVVAESLILTSIGAGATVSIDQYGKLRAENADISGIVTTENLDTESIIFSDTITVALASESQTESYSYTATGTNPIVMNLGNGYVRILFGLNVSPITLKQTKIFVVTISYNKGGSIGTPYEHTANIEIPAGSSSGSTFVDVWDDDGLGISNFKKKSVYPSQFTQYVTTGFTALGINSNLMVTGNVLPKTDNTYDIGASDRRWDDVYATNGTIQTSDLRNKKDVSYDISVYNGLFDKLRPVSYKFNEGNRTHLGFIAQDLRDSLVEQGIETQDFAGFIKALKFNSREKAPEDLTEDDYVYGIRYSELHAMEVKQIQLLKDYVQKLEARIAALESDEGS